MSGVFVAGAGMTRFGKFPERRIEDLGAEAALAAVADSGLGLGDIDTVYCGNALGGGNLGQRIMAEVGMARVPAFNLENACASGSSAFHQAYLAVRSGVSRAALALGIEQMSTSIKGLIPTDRLGTYEVKMGMVNPGAYAMIAQRHMHEFGTTPEEIASVAVKAHDHGATNPRAQYRNPITVEEVRGSRPVAEPLHLYDCCPTGDGAAAVVVTGSDVVDGDRRPVEVVTSVIAAGCPEAAGYGTTNQTVVDTSRRAYEEAGMGPHDFDVVELHDCFTMAEVMHTEDLGLCEKGKGGPYIAERRTSYGGDVVVNPSGGLLCKGHPIGATGVAQVCESTWQLRGEAEARQVEGARSALTLNIGGVAEGLDAAACVVNVFKA